MSKCVNIQIGELLHAYELGMLRGGELERFELHILECKHCCEELKQSQMLANVMTTSPEIRADAKRLSSEEDATEPKWKQHLWPQATFVLLRPALLLIVIALLAFPAIKNFSHVPIDKRMIIPIEKQVSLARTRSAENAPQIGISERTSIDMRFPNVAKTGVYALQIVNVAEGKVVYTNRQTRFDESLITSIVIEPNSLAVGDYFVRLRNTDGSGDWEDIYFRVVPVITNPPQ